MAYRVNPNCADTASEIALVQIGADLWNGLSNFSFTYGGPCSTVTGGSHGDARNDVYWTSSEFAAGSKTLA